MFGFFKKKQQEFPSAEELKRLTAAAREEVKAKWKYFNETIKLEESIPLSQKIDFFVQPIQEFLKKQISRLAYWSHRDLLAYRIYCDS